VRAGVALQEPSTGGNTWPKTAIRDRQTPGSAGTSGEDTGSACPHTTVARVGPHATSTLPGMAPGRRVVNHVASRGEQLRAFVLCRSAAQLLAFTLSLLLRPQRRPHFAGATLSLTARLLGELFSFMSL
jgi:hypothetical protein